MAEKQGRKVLLPDGSVVQLDPNLPEKEAIRKLVSSRQDLQQRYGVEVRKSTLGDLGDAFERGVANTGLGLAWFQSLKDPAGSTDKTGLTQQLEAYRDENLISRSVGAIEAANLPWYNPRRWPADLAESAPSTLLTMPVGGVGFALPKAAASGLGQFGSRVGMGKLVGEVGEETAGRILAGTAGQRTAEGIIAGGQQGYETERALLEAGASPDQAREGAQVAALGGGIATTLLGAVAPTDFATTMMMGGVRRGLLANAARGGVSEAIEEAAQSGGEQVAQNYGMTVGGVETPFLQGVPEAMGHGAILGALGGGGLGAGVGAVNTAQDMVDASREAAGNRDFAQNYLPAQQQRAAEMRDALEANGVLQPDAPDPATVELHRSLGEVFVAQPPELNADPNVQAALTGELRQYGMEPQEGFTYGAIMQGDEPLFYRAPEGSQETEFLSPATSTWVPSQTAATAPETTVSVASRTPITEDLIVEDERRAQIRAEAESVVKAQLERMNLPGVKVKAVDILAGPDGNLGEGVVTQDEQGNPLLKVAVGHLKEDLSEEDFVTAVHEVMGHEGVHAAEDAGLLKPEAKAAFLKEGERRLYPGHKFTYRQWAENKYAEPYMRQAAEKVMLAKGINSIEDFRRDKQALKEAQKLAREGVESEIIAEINRHQRQMEKPNSAAYRAYTDRLKRAFRALTGAKDQIAEYSAELMGAGPEKATSPATPAAEAASTASGEVEPPTPVIAPEGAVTHTTPQVGAPPVVTPAEPISTVSQEETVVQSDVQAREDQGSEPVETTQTAQDHPPVPASERFSFVGEKAQGLPEKLLAKFLKDEARGRHPASLYKETGFWRGRDGKLRFEISDHAAELHMDAPERGKLPQLLKHKELYRAYPILKTISYTFDNLDDNIAGSFNPVMGYMTLNVNSQNYDEDLNTVLHEMQHAIQTIEEMANGGSTGYVLAVPELSRKAMALSYEMTAYHPKLSRQQYLDKYWPKIYHGHPAIEQFYKATRIADSEKRQTAIERMPLSYLQALDKVATINTYKALHGEVEARHTEARRDLTPDERRINSPLRHAEYEGGIVMPPITEEQSPWLQDVNEKLGYGKAVLDRYSYIHNTANTPNTRVGQTPVIADPQDFGGPPRLGAVPVDADEVLVEQYTALEHATKAILSPAGFRLGGKFGVRWDKEKVQELSDKAITNIQSEAWPVKQLMVRAKKMGAVTTDRSDPVAMMFLFHGRTRARLDAAHDTLYKPFAKAMNDIRATKKDLEDVAAFVSGVNGKDEAGKNIETLADILLLEEGQSFSQKMTELYLYARHARERNEYIETVRQRHKLDEDGNPIPDEYMEDGSGMSNEEADKLLEWFQNWDKFQQMKSVATIADSLVRSTNRHRFLGNLIPDWEKLRAANPDRAHLIPQFKHYMPLRGVRMGTFVEESDDPFASMVGQQSKTAEWMNKGTGFSTKGREDPRMKGRVSYARDLVENVIRQHEHAIVRAQKNNIGLAFKRWLEDNMERVPELKTMFKIDPREPMVPVVGPDGKVRMSKDWRYKDRPDVFVVKEGGREIPIEIRDPEVAQALKNMANLGDGGMNSLLKLIAPITGIMGRLNTAWNLEFPMSNLPRDLQEGMIRSSKEMGGRRSVKLLPRVAKNVGLLMAQKIAHKTGAPKGQALQQFERLDQLGAFTGVYGLRGIEETITRVDNLIRRSSTQTMQAGDYAMVGITTLGKLIEGMNDIFEAATRMAVYETAMEHGFSEFRAAQMAKTTTINFNEKGRWGPSLGALYMLANARIQGQANFLTGLNSPRVAKMLVALAGAGLFQEMWNAWIGGDDEDENPYEKLVEQQPHMAEQNWIFLAPGWENKQGDERFFRVPKPPGFGVFQDIGRYAFRVPMGKSTLPEASFGVLGSLSQGFNIWGAKNLAGMAPSVLRPPFEVMGNVNWTNEAITPTQLPFGVQPNKSSQHFANTPEWAVKAAKALNEATGGEGEFVPGKIDIHPDAIEHFFTSYGGGALTTGNRIAETISAAINGDKPKPGARERNFNDYPVVRRFVGEVSDVTSRKFFESYIERYIQFDKQYKAYEDQGNDAAIEAMETKRGNDLIVAESAVDYAKDLVKIGREMSEVKEDPDIDDAEKVVLLKELQAEQQALIKEALADIKAQEKELNIHRTEWDRLVDRVVPDFTK